MRLLLLMFAGLTVFAQEQPKPAEEAKQEQTPSEAKPAEQAAAPAAETAKTPPETGITGSMDFGYRWVDVRGGDWNTYRSVVNLGEGPRLFNFDAAIRPVNRRWVDRIDLHGIGWGGDPYSTTRVSAFKERAYDLRLDYRGITYFNFLPSFANPLLERGINLTERAYDTRIRNFDSELRFMPGTRFVPYIAFDRNTNRGTGVTTFVSSGNEYPVWNNIANEARRFRSGVQIQLERFHATVEGGGNTFNDDQLVNYAGTSLGNRTNPFLGQRLNLTGVTQNYLIRGDNVFARALLSYTPASWLDLSGQFLYSRPTTDVTYNESSTGNLANISTLQFFNSQRDFATAYASQPHTSGSYLIDIRPARRFRVLESLSVDRFHVASNQMLSQLTSLTTTPSLSDFADRLVVNYNRHQTEAMFDLIPALTLRGGFRYVWGDVESRGALTGLTPRENAELSQSVGLAGFQLRLKQRFTVNGDLEAGTTSRAFFRTSLYNYRRSSVRVRYQATGSLSFNVHQSMTANRNPTPSIDLDFLYSQSSAGFQWNPRGGQRVGILGEYTHARLRSNVTFINLPFFTPAISEYRDYSHTFTGLLNLTPRAKFATVAAGGSYFRSSGSRPTAYYQPQAQVTIPLHEHVQWNTEWRWYGMSQNFYTFEGFRTHTFLTSLRLVR